MSLTRRPLVSVLMPVYNAAPYLQESLESIRRQTLDRTEIEILLVDDGCTDASMEIVMAYKQSGVVLLRNAKNDGLAASLNRAIREAKGKYLARMDADDISMPDRLEKQVAFMEKYPDVDFSGSALKYIGHSDYKEVFPETHEACQAKLLFNVCFGHPSVIFRAEVFKDERNFYNPRLRQYSEEYDLWCRLAFTHRMANLNEALVRYRTFPPTQKSEAEALRRENSRRIRRTYLERLLGPVSDEEFEVHTVLADLPVVPAKTLASVLGWMDELMDRNEKHKSFEPDSLKQQLAKRFFELCYVNPGAGRKRYVTSIWTGLYQPSGAEHFKLAMKSILKP